MRPVSCLKTVNSDENKKLGTSLSLSKTLWPNFSAVPMGSYAEVPIKVTV